MDSFQTPRSLKLIEFYQKTENSISDNGNIHIYFHICNHPLMKENQGIHTDELMLFI